ncbi:hypothetical protein Hanom_Chr00s132381g01815881 [Helianthus anomalus]
MNDRPTTTISVVAYGGVCTNERERERGRGREIEKSGGERRKLATGDDARRRRRYSVQ